MMGLGRSSRWPQWVLADKPPVAQDWEDAHRSERMWGTGKRPVIRGIGAIIMKKNLVAVLVVLVLTTAAAAQESSAMINRALDERIKELKLDTTLPKAMERIGEETGVKL